MTLFLKIICLGIRGSGPGIKRKLIVWSWMPNFEERCLRLTCRKWLPNSTTRRITAKVNRIRFTFSTRPPETIADRTSPLDWGTDCDYGQTNNHRHGAIFVSPSLAYTATLQHVQRLIGLFLQANASILQSSKNRSDPADWHNISCISCGNSEHRKLAVAYYPTKAGNGRWVIKCYSCSLLTVKTICYSCKTELYKNGPRWTYHRTRAEQMSNVVCPSCKEFL